MFGGTENLAEINQVAETWEWDVDVLPLDHRGAIVAYRHRNNVSQRVSCYRVSECRMPMRNIGALKIEIENIIEDVNSTEENWGEVPVDEMVDFENKWLGQISLGQEKMQSMTENYARISALEHRWDFAPNIEINGGNWDPNNGNIIMSAADLNLTLETERFHQIPWLQQGWRPNQ